VVLVFLKRRHLPVTALLCEFPVGYGGGLLANNKQRRYSPAFRFLIEKLDNTGAVLTERVISAKRAAYSGDEESLTLRLRFKNSGD
jgi:hypothetical protein